GNANIDWTKFKVGFDIKQCKTDEERSIFSMLNTDGDSKLSKAELDQVVTGKVTENGKTVNKQFIKIKDLGGGRSLVQGEDGKQHVLTKDGKIVPVNQGLVSEFTQERRYKTGASSFEALAWALYKGEGVTNPSKEQIKARTEQLKNLNPNLKDGQLKGQKVLVKTTPERMAELRKNGQKEADGIAKEFYDIADHNHGADSIQKMQNLVDKKFTADNIEAVLDKYDKYKQKDSSIIDTVLSEWGAAITPKGQNAQKNVLRSMMSNLADAASNAGVPKAEIDKYTNDFEKGLAAIGYEPKPNPARLERALDGLRGAIAAKRAGAGKISKKEAMAETQNIAAQEQKEAATQFNEARAAEKGSWSAKIGDWGMGYVGMKTNADMAEEVKEYADWVEALQNAKTKEEFNDIFQNGGFNEDGLRFSGTGVPFDESKIAARKELVDKYEYATNMNTTRAAAVDCKFEQTYEGLRAKIKKNFQMDDATVDQIILSYSPVMGRVSFTNEEKEQ
ncbi:MAG: hypothetical protein II085_02360, partial [Alphaproteobacteria bacterium]|nr:hypothetical protein [Alphaproteobacteria bacterium]